MDSRTIPRAENPTPIIVFENGAPASVYADSVKVLLVTWTVVAIGKYPRNFIGADVKVLPESVMDRSACEILLSDTVPANVSDEPLRNVQELMDSVAG